MSGNFALELSRFTGRTQRNMDVVTRKVLIHLMRSVVRKSPVGNPDLWVTLNNGQYVDYQSVHGLVDYTGGHFKANWQYGDGAMPSDTVDTINPNDGAAIDAMTARLPERTAGKLHFIVNNLPYSVRLEHGWSTQAPSGMVGLAISEYPGIVRQAVSELGA